MTGKEGKEIGWRWTFTKQESPDSDGAIPTKTFTGQVPTAIKQ